MRCFEIIRGNTLPGRLRVAVFDFDGTVSLLRYDWQDIMIELAARVIPPREGETHDAVRRLAAELVHSTNGKPTLEQMQRLADLVCARAGHAHTAGEYKRMYLERLLRRVEPRVSALERGATAPETWQMPGVRTLLEALAARGIICYLASGTDQEAVRREATALGLAHFFACIYGATDDLANSSKAAILARLVQEHALGPGELVAFGDGAEEIRLCKQHHGIAIGLARDTLHEGQIDPASRPRLIQAGADVIIADFRTHTEILEYLFPVQERET